MVSQPSCRLWLCGLLPVQPKWWDALPPRPWPTCRQRPRTAHGQKSSPRKTPVLTPGRAGSLACRFFLAPARNCPWGLDGECLTTEFAMLATPLLQHPRVGVSVWPPSTLRACLPLVTSPHLSQASTDEDDFVDVSVSHLCSGECVVNDWDALVDEALTNLLEKSR